MRNYLYKGYSARIYMLFKFYRTAINSNSFSDVSENLGYVIAMLPDMLINMFTGRTQNFRMENNILPIASIFAAMFVKNPLIKMLMVGLGGAGLLKSAGTEVLSYGNPNDNKVYKKYLDEPLNSRLSDPAVKGSSLFVDIDNIPMVINLLLHTGMVIYL